MSSHNRTNSRHRSGMTIQELKQMTAQRLAMQGMQIQGGVRPASVSSYASVNQYGSVDQLAARGGHFRGAPQPSMVNRLGRKPAMGLLQVGGSSNQQMGTTDFASSYNSYISQMQNRVKVLQNHDLYTGGEASSNGQQQAFNRQLQYNQQQGQGQALSLDMQQQQQQQNRSYELGNLYSSESDVSLSMSSFQQTEPSRSMSPSSDGTNTDSLVSSTSGLNINAPVFQGQRRAHSNPFKDAITEEESSTATGATTNTSSSAGEGRTRFEVPALSINLDKLNLESYSSSEYDDMFNSEDGKGASALLPLFRSVENTEGSIGTARHGSSSGNTTPRSLRRDSGSLGLAFPDKTALNALEGDNDSGMVDGVISDDQFLNFLESPPDSARRSFTSIESKRRTSNTSTASHNSHSSHSSKQSNASGGMPRSQNVRRSSRSSSTSSNSNNSNSNSPVGAGAKSDADGKRRPSNTSMGSHSSDSTLNSRSRTSSGIEITTTSSPQTTIWKKLANPEKNKAFGRKMDDFVISDDQN